jgi:polysaccharide pyruvyl transferase CsaB
VRALDPGLRFTVASADPERTAAHHDVEAVLWTDVPGLMRAAEASRLVLLGGGGLLDDRWDFEPGARLTRAHGGLSYYGGFSDLAVLFGKPLMVYAVGVGPLATAAGRRHALEILAPADAITVRDADSAALLVTLGLGPERVEVTADPAFGLVPAPATPPTGHLPRPWIGVALRHWDTAGDPAAREACVAEAVDRALEGGGSALFVPLQAGTRPLEDDAAVAERVRRRMRRAARCLVIPAEAPVEEKAAVLAGCDAVLGMRLHALIFALCGGAPAVGLAYDPKVSSLMKGAGLSSSTWDLERLDAAGLAAHLAAALALPPAERDRLRAWSCSMAARARQTAVRAVDLLGTSRGGERAAALRSLTVLKVRQAVEEHDRAAEAAAARDALRSRVVRLEGDLRASKERVDSLRTLAAALDHEVATIKATVGWRLLQRLWGLRRALAPEGSARARVLRRLLRGPERGATSAFRPGASISLLDVLERVARSKGAVVFLPSIGWSVSLFQRPHHLARAFARKAYVAIFDTSNAPHDVQGFQEIEPGLFLFNGPMEQLHQVPRPLLWTFPYNYHLAAAFPAPVTVLYDWIDDLSVFTGYDPALLRRNHERALERADLVVAVARTLHERAAAARPDALYLPNAVEVERFSADAAVPEDPALARLRADGKPIAGYYGALAPWLDDEMLAGAARLRRDWNFLLIGPEYERSLRGAPLLDEPNVTWIGPRPYQTLPGYLRLFDVAMIPFRLNAITLATSPLKLYEYFAGGKPVITSALPECTAHPEVTVVSSAAELAAALDRTRELGRQAAARERLQAVAGANSWEERAARVEAVLATRPPAEAALLGLHRPGEVEPTPRGRVVAERCAAFRRPDNPLFFQALANYLARGDVDDPLLDRHFEFAIGCNARGRAVAALMRPSIDVRGRRVLDVGCAYGGFLVAFAEAGAWVAGIDTNPFLLELARCNLADRGIAAPLLQRDVTDPRQLAGLEESFDLVTCNDVLEHVSDPAAAVAGLARLLVPGGCLYVEVPNRSYPRFVLRDGHFEMFGITLLAHEDARLYHAARYPGMPYDVGHYLDWEEYERLMHVVGLRPQLLERPDDDGAADRVLQDVARVREVREAELGLAPEAVRGRVAQAVDRYLAEIAAAPRATAAEQRGFRMRYGIDFWRALAWRSPSG